MYSTILTTVYISICITTITHVLCCKRATVTHLVPGLHFRTHGSNPTAGLWREYRRQQHNIQWVDFLYQNRLLHSMTLIHCTEYRYGNGCSTVTVLLLPYFNTPWNYCASVSDSASFVTMHTIGHFHVKNIYFLLVLVVRKALLLLITLTMALLSQ